MVAVIYQLMKYLCIIWFSGTHTSLWTIVLNSQLTDEFQFPAYLFFVLNNSRNWRESWFLESRRINRGDKADSCLYSRPYHPQNLAWPLGWTLVPKTEKSLLMWLETTRPHFLLSLQALGVRVRKSASSGREAPSLG